MSRRIIRRVGALALIALAVDIAFLLGIFVAMYQPVGGSAGSCRTCRDRSSW
jgi:hypothetical protein